MEKNTPRSRHTLFTSDTSPLTPGQISWNKLMTMPYAKPEDGKMSVMSFPKINKGAKPSKTEKNK